jgi:hypothetical protein
MHALSHLNLFWPRAKSELASKFNAVGALFGSSPSTNRRIGNDLRAFLFVCGCSCVFTVRWPSHAYVCGRDLWAILSVVSGNATPDKVLEELPLRAITAVARGCDDLRHLAILRKKVT